MKVYKSNAQWPVEVYKGVYGDGISTDSHGTEGEAKAVCRRLESEGFGGDKEVFPIKTWVTEIVGEK